MERVPERNACRHASTLKQSAGLRHFEPSQDSSLRKLELFEIGGENSIRVGDRNSGSPPDRTAFPMDENGPPISSRVASIEASETVLTSALGDGIQKGSTTPVPAGDSLAT